MAIPWATNLLHFHLNKLLEMVSNLALFCLATYLATFQKIGQFFPNHLVGDAKVGGPSRGRRILRARSDGRCSLLWPTPCRRQKPIPGANVIKLFADVSYECS
jgi:hypothetical protein